MKVYELRTGSGDEYDPAWSTHGLYSTEAAAWDAVIAMAREGDGPRCAEVLTHEIQGAVTVSAGTPAFVLSGDTVDALRATGGPWHVEGCDVISHNGHMFHVSGSETTAAQDLKIADALVGLVNAVMLGRWS